MQDDTTTIDQGRWTLNELLSALGMPRVDNDVPITEISIDTRTMKPGALYVAIEGAAHDGHSFVHVALERGCAAVLIHHPLMIAGDAPCVRVKDTLVALQTLGAYVRSQSRAVVVAVTGSVGKTTTKDMITHVLSNFGTIVSSKESFNNHWGVPLSLLDLQPSTDFGVFEVGMNHPGEIAPLTDLICPNISVITAIGEAHIGHFKSISDIAKEKASIFSGMPYEAMCADEQNGFAIINADTEEVKILTSAAKHLHTVLCGSQGATQVTLLERREVQIKRHWNTQVTARVYERTFSYILPLIGAHYVQNSLLVLGACAAIGVDLNVVCKALETYTLPAGRGTPHAITLEDGKHIVLVDDAYNANPTSMRAGLTTLAESPVGKKMRFVNPEQWVLDAIKNKKETADDSGPKLRTRPETRRIVVLGDMLELGNESATQHKALAHLIAEINIDSVFCCGVEMQHLYQALPFQKRAGYERYPENLIPHVLAYLREGDVVYVKGSKGSRVSIIVDYLMQNYLHRMQNMKALDNI